MDVVETQAGDVTVLAPGGRIDSVTCKAFEEQVMARINGGTTRLLVDFGNLDYISSAGLRVLLMAAKRLKAAKGRFAICAMKDHIREVFEVSGFAGILDIQPDRDTALAAMG